MDGASSRLTLLAVLSAVLNPALSGLVTSGSFIINDVVYPASSSYTAVYIISGFGDEGILDIICNHSLVDVGADWTLQSLDFDGPGAPVTPRPVPIGKPVPILDSEVAITKYSADSSNTVTFFDPTEELEGIYSCLGSLQIRLTFSNPYVESTSDSLIRTLTPTISLFVVALYSEAGVQSVPDVGNVRVSYEGTDLTILGDVESGNPYETIYDVVRPENLLIGEINFEVNIEGMIGNDTISITIEDFFEKLAALTVVREGEKVVLNCTTTNPEVRATFNGFSEVSPPNEPGPNVWQFTADNVLYSGFYRCTASRLFQGTSLVIFPDSLEREVAFIDLDDDSFLPDSYIILNDQGREGINIACVSRNDGNLAFSSLNDTLTAVYASIDGSDSFAIGKDFIQITKGNRFIRLSMTVEQEYEDLLTCSSDTSSETAKLRIVADDSYVAVAGTTTSITVDYGVDFNLTYTYVSIEDEGFFLTRDGIPVPEPQVTRNDQLITFTFPALAITEGLYVLSNSPQDSSDGATILVQINYPELSISPAFKEVEEGEIFTLTCTSTIPGIPVIWNYPMFEDFPNVEVNLENLTVFGAIDFNGGNYTCSVMEPGEEEFIIVASATATVEVLLRCPVHFAGGILWNSTSENEIAFNPCRAADSRFSEGVMVTRVCGPGGIWWEPNFSGCTLTSGDPQQFIIFSLYYVLNLGTNEDVIEGRDMIKEEFDTNVVSDIGENFLESFVTIPDPILNFIGEFGRNDVVHIRYTVTFNTFVAVEDFFHDDLESLIQIFHCNRQVVLRRDDSGEPVEYLRLSPDLSNGDTFGFVRSDVCECRPTLVQLPPIDGGFFPPLNEQRRRRGLTECQGPFRGFQNTCNGTTAPPCICPDPEQQCQCADFYVGNGDYCVVDRDGDSYPELIPEIICEGDTTSSYCMLDVCPNVPNEEPDDPTPCEGCPEHYAGGILWSFTPENMTAFKPCRDADNRFSEGVVVTRVCGPGGIWSEPNFSGCTLTSGNPQQFVIFSLYYEFNFGSLDDLMDGDEEQLQRDLDSFSSEGFEFQQSSVVIVPSSAPAASRFLGIPDVVYVRYTLTLGTSDTLKENFAVLLQDLIQLFHCGWWLAIVRGDELRQQIAIRLSPDPFNGDTFGFTRSDVCECRPALGSLLLPPLPDDIPDPPPQQPPDDNLPRRKRGNGAPQCQGPFPGLQYICNGTTAAPCLCLDPRQCQCTVPYVGNGDFCVLDRDGDSYPELIPEIICKGDNTSSYCMLDVCPNVPNVEPDDTTPCEEIPGEEFCALEVDDVWQIDWPNTLVGETATVPCGANFTGNSSRVCGAGGVWDDPDVSRCSSRVFAMVQAQIALLVDQDDVDVEATLVVFEELVEVTEEPLFPADVDTAIDNVDSLLSLLEEDIMVDGEAANATAIFEVLDNLLIDGNMESFEELRDEAGSQRVLDNVERYALYVARVLQEEGENVIINQTGDNIVLRAENVPLEDLEDSYVFPDAAEATGLALVNGSSASITLPNQLLRNRMTGGNVGVASVLFRNLQSFLPSDSEAPPPRSLVISSQVADRGGDGVTDPILEENPVLITFTFEAAEDEEIEADDVECSFWDFSLSEEVRWSTEGLRTVEVTRDGNTVTVVCASTHLTSFAVLVDVGGAQLEDEALRIVSYIGLAISLACLLLTILFFLSFGKKLFSAVHNFVHLNLAIALFCGYLVFAVGIELANHEKVPCNVVTALIQYFLLAAFCWMMCEGIMLYLMLVVVFSKIKKKWWFFAIVGWGIPVISVVIGLATVHDEYGVKADSESDDYYKYCWLSSGNGTYAIWTFVAPMLAIIIINTVFLILVLYSIFKNRAGRQKKVEAGYKVDVVKYVVKASVILLPLLGLTWVFGLFAINENTVVFAWLFTIFNSLQGLFIFFFHVVRNDRVWGKFKKRYGDYYTSKASRSTGSTGVKSSKYHTVSSSTAGGMELKEKQSVVDPEVSEAVDFEEPKKEALA